MKINLTFKILFAITMVVVVILSSLGFFMINSQRNLLYNSQRDLGMKTTKSLGSRINSREKITDSGQLQSEIERAMNTNPMLVEARIVLPRKAQLKVVGASNEELIGGKAGSESISVFESGELATKIYTPDEEKVMRVISPVYVGNQKVGVYYLQFSLARVEQMISKIQKRFAYGILAVIPQLIIILYLLLRSTILNPINKLRKGAEAVESGNFEFRVDLDRRDEIGMLANSFNRMAEKVSDFYENLDEKVEEMITNSASEAEIKKYAVKNGMITLTEDGKEKVKDGLTSYQEIARLII